MTPCPVCEKPVDTLRARYVAVRAGKVVAYCSPECKAKAEGMPAPAPTAAAATPTARERTKTPPGGAKVQPRREDFDSGPVIEILHEPASGVVTSAPDPRASEPTAKAADTKPVVKPDVAANKTQEIDPREFLGDDDEDADDDDDEKPGKSAVRRRRDSVDAKLAHDWLDDEPADVRPGTHEDDEAEAPRRGKGMLVVLVLLFLAAGGLAVYKLVYLPRVKASAEKQKPPEPVVQKVPVVEIDAAAPLPEPATAAIDRAVEVLRKGLASNSDRVPIKAAIALSRTGDAAAIARLTDTLDHNKEKLEEAALLDIAYALARAGNEHGKERLVTALGSQRRDDRLAAARMLTELGDARAVPALVNILDLPQNRLAAAALLARFKDPKGIAALEAVRTDAGASDDQKLTATIALAAAGKAELVADVKKMLDDTRFNVDAAAALAGLHDEAARPVLEKQLAITQLRVEAARSLRRLAPDGDTAAYVKQLVDSLADPKHDKDTEHIPTAEAILLLAGPKTLADHK